MIETCLKVFRTSITQQFYRYIHRGPEIYLFYVYDIFFRMLIITMVRFKMYRLGGETDSVIQWRKRTGVMARGTEEAGC